jgi:hypothetical protein
VAADRAAQNRKNGLLRGLRQGDPFQRANLSWLRRTSVNLTELRSLWPEHFNLLSATLEDAA